MTMRWLLPRPFPALAALLLLLCGCDKVETLDIEVRSDHEVVMHLGSRRCVEHLEIGTSEMRNTILWRIEREPNVPATCPRDITFPHAPPGYRVTITADRLPKGSYALSGMAQGYSMAGHFNIRPR